MRRALAWMFVAACGPAIDAAVETSTATTGATATSDVGTAPASSTTTPSDTTARRDWLLRAVLRRERDGHL